MNRWDADEFDGWHFDEDKMKEKGIYIVAKHHKYGNFILIFGDRDDKQYINAMKKELTEYYESSYQNP